MPTTPLTSWEQARIHAVSIMLIVMDGSTLTADGREKIIANITEYLQTVIRYDV